MLEPGRYTAKVTDAGIISSTGKGTPGINLQFTTLSGDKVYCTKWLTANTIDHVATELTKAGIMTSKKMDMIADGSAFCRETECEITVVHEIYEKDGESKTAVKVEWINSIGGGGMKGKLAEKEAISKLSGLNLEAAFAVAEQSTGVKIQSHTPKDVAF